MPAPEGNNFRMKWKTAAERQAACDEFCAHIASGLSQECFPGADWDTVQRYIKDFPEDFPSEKIEEAKRKQRQFWEIVGREGATGKTQGFNATAWIFNMKNRFRADWNDRSQVELTGKDGGPVQTQDVPASQRLAQRLEAIERRISGGESE